MHLVFPIDVVFLALHFLKVKLGPGHPLVDVLNVVTGGLKVSGSIIGAGDEDLKQNHKDVRRGVSRRRLRPALLRPPRSPGFLFPGLSVRAGH